MNMAIIKSTIEDNVKKYQDKINIYQDVLSKMEFLALF